mmetsp:Transcript_15354/g.31147  ORF Transcript_15354/g.31147 Transcript_15354/m.31147 type:complete len:237 (-) Transcript_15354:357-1067(-)
MYQSIDESRTNTLSKRTTTLVAAVAVVACVVAGSMFFTAEPRLEAMVRSPAMSMAGCRSVAVNAQPQGRRSAMAGLSMVAGGLAAKGAMAARNVELIDDRVAKKNGFDIIYEARDLSLDQDTRDGMTQARSGLADTKTRVSSAAGKLEEAGAFAEKKYWTEGRNILRRLVGTLRFDLAALADQKSGAAKKEAIKANKDFFAQLESLDLAMYKKNPESAAKAYKKTMAAYKTAASLY